MPIDKARAKGLLGVGQKPQSAVTSWVDRICQSSKPVAESDLNQFIVELVDVINLQPTGPEEASRAVRKQLKHGDITHQKNALNLLASLVLNGGSKFQTTFADERMVDCIKSLVYDARTDPTVRRQTMILLSYWSKTFQSDPTMSTVAGLYSICGGSHKLARLQPASKQTSPPISKTTNKTSMDSINSNDLVSTMISGMEKDTAKAIKAAQKSKKKEERSKKPKNKIDQRFRTKLPLPLNDASDIDLKEEAPGILNVVATAAQCANNLVNSIQLINPETHDVRTDEKVQTNLEKAKTVQKRLIRYIRLVTDRDTNGDYIGTLVNTNAQVVAALELYEKQIDPSKDLNSSTKRLKDLNIRPTPAPHHEERGLFDDPETPISPNLPIRPSTNYNEDLLGLDFGSEGDHDSDRLPKPIAPDSYQSSTQAQVNRDYDPGTLSDFSDFDSSNEDEPQVGLISPLSVGKSTLIPVDQSVTNRPEPSGSKSREVEDNNPFADPFL
ncbi:uncharacterized protein MELLADRAFT_115777 [Melampsora larici-populina 98AG31]|uniref:VHS domain-containing protein n=1 Tax=Melampsora larici-populina (strain 98AG31 / pathotype 3-4-7) TaxID=747676 RepID=F4RE24_MELLP|nr:uncharacterized protein MELLADRAFT_115777 [Melampsora larici-populina 98AG31]EGG09514.1 hypothetical protein MELLADRAFT_115777 [Melampsora larici-populina 98AG31]